MVVVEQKVSEYLDINIVTTYPNWDESTTYQFDEILFYEHYYYKNVIDDNLGLIPSDNSASWLLWEVSNRYAQIDLRATTTTTWNATTATVPADDALISRFANNSYDFIGLGGVLGSSVTIEVLDDVLAVLYTVTEDIYFRQDADWYGYYFGEFGAAREQGFIFRIPPYSGGSIRVTVVAEDGSASVGYMVVGNSVWVGDSLYGASVGLNSNSNIEVDDFGITTITRRQSNETMDIDTTFPSTQIQTMKRTARGILDKTVLFVGDESEDSVYEHLGILGYIESWDVILANPVQITSSYSIKEVI